jgi:hypothetical protein
MVVFNLPAVPIVLLVGAVGAGLIWTMPGVFGGPHEEITYSVLATIIGGLGELVGLRGRLFFLPIWLIGGAVLAWQLWSLFGLVGLFAGVALVGLLLVAFVAVIVLSMAAAEKEAPEKLAEARALLAQRKFVLAKKALGEAFVLPSVGAIQAERACHLLEVVTLVEQHEGPLAIRGDGPRLVAACRTLLERAVRDGSRYGFFSDEANLLAAVEPMLAEPDAWKLRDDQREMLAKVA